MKWPLFTPEQLPLDEQRFMECCHWHLAHRFDVPGVSGIPFPPAVYEWVPRLHFTEEQLSTAVLSLVGQDLLWDVIRDDQRAFILTERGVQYLYRSGLIEGAYRHYFGDFETPDFDIELEQGESETDDEFYDRLAEAEGELDDALDEEFKEWARENVHLPDFMNLQDKASDR